MIKSLTDNWGWKILSLCLAILLWVVVVNIEDPRVSTTIRGVFVEKKNESAITSQKQAIQYVSGDTIDIKVEGKRSLVFKLSKEDIRAYADMKNLSITGAVDIQVELPNEVNLVSKSPSSLSVQLENVIRKQVPISYEKIGNVKNGFVDLKPTLTPDIIELEAAESIIYKIAKVSVPVNIEGISNDFTISVHPQIFDYSGNQVTGVTYSTKQVSVKVPVEKKKTVPIRFEAADEPAENYEFLGIEMSQERVSVRGKAEVLDQFHEILINHIALSEIKEKQKIVVNLAKLLPDGVSLNQDSFVMDVIIDMEEVVEKEFVFSLEEIALEWAAQSSAEADGWKAIYLETDPIPVKYRSVKSKVESLQRQDIIPKVIIENIQQGKQTVPIQYREVPDMEYISDKNEIEIEILAPSQADAS